MKLTVQTHADSGNWANPDGTQDLSLVDSLSAAKDVLWDWAEEVDRYDSPQDAYAYVWCGHHDDVTDLYPDWKLTVGPRGGIRREAV